MNEEIVNIIVSKFKGTKTIAGDDAKHKARFDIISRYIDEYPNEVEEAIRDFNIRSGCTLNVFNCYRMECGDEACVKNTMENILYNYNCHKSTSIKRRV